MKSIPYSLVLALSAFCLILSITLVFSGLSNQKLQMSAQQQQEEITKGQMSQQIGSNLVRDIAQLSVKNDTLKSLLAKNGFTVTVNPPAGSPSPSPAKP